MTAPRARADLHIHPAGDRYLGGDSTGFLAALQSSNLAVAALTDHDRIDLAQDLARQALDAGIATELVVGEEISTAEGHLLGLWLTDPVTPGQSLADSIAAVHDQGGLAVVAHPLLPTALSASGRLLATLAQGPARQRPDGLEVFNPMAAWIPLEAWHVTRFARNHGYPLVGASDGHRPGDVGRGFTTFDGSTALELRAAILAGTTDAGGVPYGPRDAARGVFAQLRERGLNPRR